MSAYVSASAAAASSADFSPTAKTAKSIESNPSKCEQRLDKREEPSLHHASLKGDGETPLQLASKYKKAETARALLEHGAAGITIESLRALIQM